MIAHRLTEWGKKRLRAGRRLRGHDVLGLPNRRRIHDIVLEHPGISFRELVLSTGLGAGTVRHHLTVLVGHAIFVEQQFGARAVFFLTGAAPAQWESVVALRDQALRELHSVALAFPGGNQRAFVEIMAERGWLRTTTVNRLARLERHGLLRSIRNLHSRRYWPTLVDTPEARTIEPGLQPLSASILQTRMGQRMDYSPNLPPSDFSRQERPTSFA